MNRWVSPNGNSASALADIFCIPFAGGGASFYRAWTGFAPPSIRLRPVQLPGREERMKEKPFDRLPDLVAAAAEGLAPFLDKPFALFGHSMGALVCYELAQELRRRGGATPMHLFVSGSPAPHLAELVPPVYDLPRERFLEAVQRFGGLPAEVLAHQELLDLLMPLLRADLAVTGTYQYRDQAPLDCPITAFAGTEDDVVRIESMEPWRDHTVSQFELRRFSGAHFFLSQHASAIVSQLAAAVTQPVS